uniref:BTB domain-containing protein n=1 Tax=Panagrolaimus davidi TaxID=227884 RepID=A0A914PGC7_9BILA
MDSPKFEIPNLDTLSIEKEQIREEIDIKIFKILGEILYNRDDKNFDISTGDGKILKVHLLVIATKIPIFQQLKESNQTKFIIPDFDYEIIEFAMKFCYGCSIAENLNASIAIKLFFY